MKQPIKNSTGKTIGYILTESNGRQVAQNEYGNILGYYDPKLNITQNSYGRKVSEGNTVIQFIYD